MTRYDGKRLDPRQLGLDIEGLRRGFYSDKYFVNVVHVLENAAVAGYRFSGSHPRPLAVEAIGVDIGNLEVEAQIFMRRMPEALVAGIDVALAMLAQASGWYEGEIFHNTAHMLKVEAVQDADIVTYGGDPEDVVPVLRICGRYRDFALLETPILGVLSRATRIATNCYEVLKVSNGKPILFFPARFDLPEVQAVDGYAYWIAVQRYNADYGMNTVPSVSTDAQGRWWGGRGVGTVPHALIATFLSDAAETMVAFALFTDPSVPRILLADFNNDVVGDSLRTLSAYWPRYLEAVQTDDLDGQRRWRLSGVRLDTSPNVRDQALDADDPGGVTPKLVRIVRQAINEAWRHWDLSDDLIPLAQEYCRAVRIAVTGGFNRERIQAFEAEQVPVDVYGVGSSLLRNDRETNSDFTMDVVRVKIDGKWIDMAKVGRRRNDNPDLHVVDLMEL